MTHTFDENSREAPAKDRSRLTRGLFNTIPIMIVGSMAIGLNVTGPIQSVEPRRDKPKTNATELGKSIREAFTAASRAQANPLLGSSADAATSVAKTSVAAAAPATYTVVAGDTVSGIAGRFGIPTASVLAVNGLGWKSIIFPGQQLTLSKTAAATPVAPAASTPTSASKAPVGAVSARYSIVRGDTMGSIASRFGVSTQSLLSANGLGWSSIIYPGQTLAIPGVTTAAVPASQTRVVETPSTTRTGTYTIATGDTVASIAAKFGLSSQAILTANNLSWSSIIYAGRTMTIPPVVALIPASSTSVVSLTPSMAKNAREILAIGRSLGVPDYGLVIALAAAAQESTLENLNYGDRDSLGLFQQRPSTGWGTPANIMTPSYASRLFFGGPSNPNKGNTRGLLDIPGWQSKSVTDAAQAVQLSGFPNAYAKWEASARSWLKILR